MAVTLAAAYFERGDSGQAVRTCRKAVAKAETLESPVARASAYWNASMIEAEQGAVSNAVPLAERALALLAEGDSGRNLALLRTQLGIMQLQLDPPDVYEAQQHLEKAAEEMVWSGASSIELARNLLARARASFLEGNFESAGVMCAEVLETVHDEAPSIAADAMTLRGQLSFALGDLIGASDDYRQAVMRLTAVGADRSAAELWFELAGLLEEVGDLDAARDAYRSAAASSGLRSRSATRVTSGASL
jgi:tetratricopeptide (TPR) repeat protein